LLTADNFPGGVPGSYRAGGARLPLGNFHGQAICSTREVLPLDTMANDAAQQAGCVTLALIGAGNRGADVYARYALQHPSEARVVAVADPDPGRRERLAQAHGIPAAHVFASWEELFARPRLADGVIIATPDRMHVEPALRALELGYDILLEKPIAPTRAETLLLSKAAARHDGHITVAHVLRYTPFFSTLKGLIDEGRIGRLMTIDHIENIGYWHFAHSYVRGNWRRADEASPMILAKACHDLDILRWLAGAPCLRVASFGHLSHFRAENRPQGAPDRCTDGCPVEATCPFNAVAFYVDGLAEHAGWPVSVITADLSREGRLAALRTGPYGRCVYACDNDVADHQVAVLEFANGVTATLTVTAFSEENTRTLKLMGTGGEIVAHLESGEIEVRPFGRPGALVASEGRTAAIGSRLPRETIRVPAGAGHAGGDEGLMRAFIDYARIRKAGGRPQAMLTSLAESIESHLMAFAAEESRTRGTVVDVANQAAAPRLDAAGGELG